MMIFHSIQSSSLLLTMILDSKHSLVGLVILTLELLNLHLLTLTVVILLIMTMKLLDFHPLTPLIVLTIVFGRQISWF